MNITEILQRQAENCPDEVAIIDRVSGANRQLTFGAYDQAVGKTATMLRHSGLRLGDTVLLFQPMSAELYIALAAILRAGMTAMFVDPSAGRKYIDRCCELLPPQGLIASSKAHLLRLSSPALRRIPHKWSVGGSVPFTPRFEQHADLNNDGGIHSCGSETAALVSFTSGSTGQPKATVRTHGFLLAQHRAVEENLALVPGEVELVTMPIFVLANLASRITSVIADADLRRVGEIEPEPVVEQMHVHAVNRIVASPAFLSRIIDCCEHQGTRLERLGKVFTGGGPVPPRLLDRLQAIAPGARITVVYGSTEAEPISTIAISEMAAEDTAAVSSGRGLLVGKPVPSLEVRVIRDCWGSFIGDISRQSFTQLCQPPSQPGEIVVSGRHVLDGYLDRQSCEDNKFAVEQTRWHRTGDAGYFDDRGRLWLLGRCAARVDDGHGALYPLGVEQAALRNQCIGNAAIVSHQGQRVLAVTLSQPNTQPDLVSLLKSLSFANVDSIRIVDRLPMDQRHQSKVDYSKLRKLLER